MPYLLGLIALLTIQIPIAGRTIAEQVATLKRGSMISIEIKPGFYSTEPEGIQIWHLRGFLGSVGPDFFVLTGPSNKKGPKIKFYEVQSIEPIRPIMKLCWPQGPRH